MQVERAAQAASRASIMNAGVATGLGYDRRIQSHEELAENLAKKTGKIARQEEEFVFAEAALESSGGGTASQRAKLKEAYAAMRAAGSDPGKVEEARSIARGIYQEIGISPDQMGGYEGANASLSGAASERIAGMAGGALQARMSGLLRRRFSTDPRFTSGMGLTSDQGAAFGMGVANMNPMLRSELGRIMSLDPAERASALAKFRADNPELAGSLGGDAEGFWDVAASGKLTTQNIEAFANAPTAYKEHRGFVSEYSRRATAAESYQSMVRAHMQSQLPNADILKKMIEGLTGRREFTEGELMKQAITEGGPGISSFSMSGDRIEGTAENLRTLQSMFSPEELEQLGVTDVASLRDPERQEKVYAAIQSSQRGIMQVSGKMYVAEVSAMKKANSTLTGAAVSKDVAFLTGAAAIRKPGQSDEEFIFAATEQARNALNDPETTKNAILHATGSGNREAINNFKTIFDSGLLSEENKKALKAETDRQLDSVQNDENRIAKELKDGKLSETEKAAKQATAKDLDRRRFGLEELRMHYISGGANVQSIANAVIHVTNGTFSNQPTTNS